MSKRSGITPAALKPTRHASETPIEPPTQGYHDHQALELTLHTNRYLADALRFGDAKAGVLLGLSGTLASWAVKAMTEAVAAKPLGWQLVAVLMFVSLIPFGASTWWAVRVVAPRFRPSKRTGMVFWNDILLFGNKETYIAAATSLSVTDAIGNVAAHNWSTSKILHEKFGQLRKAIVAFVIGALIILLGLLAQVAVELVGTDVLGQWSPSR